MDKQVAIKPSTNTKTPSTVALAVRQNENDSAVAEYLAGSSEVELSRKWIKLGGRSQDGSPWIILLPIERSGDVRDLFPPKKGQPVDTKPKHVWAARLLSPIQASDNVGMQGNEFIDIGVDEIVYFFEPPRLAPVFVASKKSGIPTCLRSAGKRMIKSRTYGDVLAWQYEVRVNPKAKPSNLLLGPGDILMPTVDDADAKRVATVDDSSDE